MSDRIPTDKAVHLLATMEQVHAGKSAHADALRDLLDARAERDVLRAQLAEAEAALLNERGAGDPTSEGWECHLHNGRPRWTRELAPGEYLVVSLRPYLPGWQFRHRHADGRVTGSDEIATARSAMRAADAEVPRGR